MILRDFISLRAFTVYMKISLRSEILLGQIDWSETCTEVSFTVPKLMWTLIRKLPYTEVKFHPEVKSQTCLSLHWVSCKRALKRLTPKKCILLTYNCCYCIVNEFLYFTRKCFVSKIFMLSIFDQSTKGPFKQYLFRKGGMFTKKMIKSDMRGNMCNQ